MKRLLFLSLLIYTLSACSDDSPEPDGASKPEPEKEIGRFDESPFKWDYSSNDTFDKHFIGEVLPKVNLWADIDKPSRDPNELVSHSNFFIRDLFDLYLGGIYNEQDILNKNLEPAMLVARNPIEAIFDFNGTSCSVSSINDELGSIGYKMALSKAVNSLEYTRHIERRYQGQYDESFVEYTSYGDIEKAFDENPSLGKLFSAKVKINTVGEKIKPKGRLLARVTRENFDAIMELTTPHLAKKEIDADVCYVQSITYGSVFYLAIESEHPYSKVQWAFNNMWNLTTLGFDLSYDETKKIMAESAVTLFVVDSSGAHCVAGIENFEKVMTEKYTLESYGLPIYLRTKYANDNSTLAVGAKPRATK